MDSKLNRECIRICVCYLCGEECAIGELVRPSDHHGWVHAKCGLHLPPPICSYWKRFRVCIYEENCAFRHPQNFVNDSIFLRPKHGKRKRNKIFNQRKATILRCFLLNKFGEDFLKGGVLDVAGGRGDLSFELQNLNNVPCTVLDPRLLELQRCLNHWNHGIYSRKFTEFTTVTPLPEEPTIPCQIPTCLTKELFHYIDDDGEKFYEKLLKEAASLTWTDKGLHEGMKREYQNGYGTCILDWKAALRKITECSIIVGLHPDQASGVMIDLAILLQKPFVIIPCCVYGKQFPKRKLLDGTRVRTESQLVQWLQEKHPNIKRSIVPFEGKNTILWLDNYEVTI